MRQQHVLYGYSLLYITHMRAGLKHCVIEYHNPIGKEPTADVHNQKVFERDRYH